MSLIGLLVALAIIGLLIWAIVTYIPMAPGWKRLIIVVGIVAAIIFVAAAFGVWDEVKSVRVPKL